jgi:hypothetical protein
MKVLHVEDVASHNGPESCTAMGNCGREALTGGNAGEVLSREIIVQLLGADVVDGSGRQYLSHRQREIRQDPARSKTLGMHPNTSSGSREILRPTREQNGALARTGNPKGAIR